ncbi:hypothetical protein [Streptomyces sp. NPDC088789]|uniref:hypothetical protein n=1 Tax=Streptomyces sp. NPDC088789 TaxID=3365899 RepID=UPI0037FDB93C
MKAIATLLQGWVVDGAALVPFLVPWSACCVPVLWGVLRLLAERSRRKTLLAVVTRAPRGTVVAQEGGIGGPRMRIEVGGEGE